MLLCLYKKYFFKIYHFENVIIYLNPILSIFQNNVSILTHQKFILLKDNWMSVYIVFKILSWLEK